MYKDYAKLHGGNDKGEIEMKASGSRRFSNRRLCLPLFSAQAAFLASLGTAAVLGAVPTQAQTTSQSLPGAKKLPDGGFYEPSGGPPLNNPNWRANAEREAALYKQNSEIVKRGDKLAVLGDLDGAIASYREALDLKPAYAAREAHIGLANVFTKKGRYTDALAQYRLASPDLSLKQGFFGGNSEVELKYVLVLCRLGKFDEARRAYRLTLSTHQDILKGITFVPLDISVTDTNYTTRQLETAALLALGIEYFWTADSVQAASKFEEAIRLKPRFAASYFFLGMALGDSYPVSASPEVQAKAKSDRTAAFEKAAALGDNIIRMRSEQELGKRSRMTIAEDRAFDARLKSRLPGMMAQAQGTSQGGRL